jgi:2-isopropylmalate synthase
MTTRERLYLFDTTLRDGAQTTGVDFSVEDKRRIAGVLAGLGVDYVEGGYPGANDTDTAFFATNPFATERITPGPQPRFTAFGMTKRSGRSAANDPGFQALLQANADAVCLVAKSWDYHVRVALGVSNEENLSGVAESVKAVKAAGREALIDCEHFFDGYKGNRDYALAVARTAFESGARWVVLCDTNGGTLPHEVERIVGELVKVIPGKNIGIHTHNDTENAVANTLAAVRAGARQIQGTLNGLGERCGNANLTSIIPTLLLKSEFSDRFETRVTPDRLVRLTHASRVLDEVLAREPDRHAPYVGESAFATKAGIHASAILKEPETYEHVVPERVGNRRRLLVAEQSGLSNVRSELAELGIIVDPADPRIGELLRLVKERADAGYGYDRAPASFELLARAHLGQVPRFYSVTGFRVIARKRRRDGDGAGRQAPVLNTEATVEVDVAGQSGHHIAYGNGPVNALDTALRKALAAAYGTVLARVELVDYRVRIIPARDRRAESGDGEAGAHDGTDATTRVLIESRDRESDERWFTVGVSPNIIDASFEALIDSINYKLLKSGAGPA